MQHGTSVYRIRMGYASLRYQMLRSALTLNGYALQNRMLQAVVLPIPKTVIFTKI